MNLRQRPDSLQTDLLKRDPQLFAQPDDVEKWRARLRSESHTKLREFQSTLAERAAAYRSERELLTKKIAPLAERVSARVGLNTERVREKMQKALVRWPFKFGDLDCLENDFPYFSEASSEQRATIRRLLREREKISEQAFELEREWFAIEVVLREDMSSGAIKDKPKSLREEDESDIPDPKYADLPLVTARYLKVAYEWIEAGNRPSGEKPTELWAHINRKMEKSKDTIRSTFKNQDWYDPNVGAAPEDQQTPTEYTIQEVRKAVEKHFP